MSLVRLIPLPFAGMLAAYLSFVLAGPFEKTLNRPEMDFADPASHYTLGTTWALVQHSTFGLLLVGLFVPILLLGRRPLGQVVLATLIWATVGGLLSVGFDAMLDAIAIAVDRPISQKSGTLTRPGGSIVTHFYGLFQTIALAFPIAFASGATKHRFNRAFLACVFGTILSEVAGVFSGFLSVGMAIHQVTDTSISLNERMTRASLMTNSIPGWMATAIGVGLALGLTMGIVEYITRTGTLRRVYGRGEFKEWELAGSSLRVGSGEVEIRLDAAVGVEPIHAIIGKQGNQHVLDSRFALTLVNGMPAVVQSLRHGDRLQIGDVELIYLAKDSTSGFDVTRATTPVPNGPRPTLGQIPATAAAATAMRPSPTSQPAKAMPRPSPVAIQVAIPSPLALIDASGSRFELAPGTHTIGREIGNSLVLATNSTVSRRHATIIVTPNSVEITDESSSNGTFVNGSRIAVPTPIHSGDEIKFGSANYRVQ